MSEPVDASGIQQQIEALQAQISNLQELTGTLSQDQIAQAIAPLAEKLELLLSQHRDLQSQVTAHDHSVAAGRNIYGNVIIGDHNQIIINGQPVDITTVYRRYLVHLSAHCQILPLSALEYNDWA
ncbi:MAG: hypothetical protein KDE09_19360, partial [Anaerolineales bacterium]|nr:hypothetical protein [Anaerolineales bacterium]